MRGLFLSKYFESKYLKIPYYYELRRLVSTEISLYGGYKASAGTNKWLSRQRGVSGDYLTRKSDNPLRGGRANRCLCPSQKKAEN